MLGSKERIFAMGFRTLDIWMVGLGIMFILIFHCSILVPDLIIFLFYMQDVHQFYLPTDLVV